MEMRTIGDLTILTPDLDPRDLDDTDDPPGDDLVEAMVTGADWSGLRLGATQVRLSHLVNVNLSRARWGRTLIYGCRFERVDLSGARLAEVRIERCEFLGCRMTGVQLIGAAVKNVVFDQCRIDLALVEESRTTGPAAFVQCGLERTRFTRTDLTRAAFAGCRLDEAEFADCDLRGADLRGNDLSAIAGVASLRGAVVTADQVVELAAPLARDLELVLRDSDAEA